MRNGAYGAGILIGDRLSTNANAVNTTMAAMVLEFNLVISSTRF
jgi:hypothetical protein